MKIGIFLFAALPFFCFADEKVVWSEADNYYAVGYATNNSSLIAKKEACISAKRELIEYVFGASYSSNRNILNTSGMIDYSQQFTINTEEARLRGVLQVPEEVQSGEFKCKITYPIAEAKIELERLELGAKLKNTKFTDIGNESDVRGGTFEILTVPDDADVYIDNKRWGTTPLRLYGKLSLGKHQVRIDKDNYEIIEQSFEIGAAKTSRLEKLLKPAMAKIRINTNIEGATIKIDGQIKGTAPTDWITIPAGRSVKIEAEHPEAELIMKSVTLGRNEYKLENIELSLKPATFSIHVNNCSNPNILLDGNNTVSDSRNFTTVAGQHNLSIHCNGFYTHETSLNLQGGEMKVLPSIDLLPIEISSPSSADLEPLGIRAPSSAELKDETRILYAKMKSPEEENEKKWAALGLIAEYSQCEITFSCPAIWQVGLVANIKMTDSFSFRVLATSDAGGTNYKDAEMRVNGFQYKIGLPYEYTETWFASPEIFNSSHVYSITYLNPQIPKREFTNEVTGYGFSISHQIDNFEIRASVNKYSDSRDYDGELVGSGSIIWRVDI